MNLAMSYLLWYRNTGMIMEVHAAPCVCACVSVCVHMGVCVHATLPAQEAARACLKLHKACRGLL